MAKAKRRDKNKQASQPQTAAPKPAGLQPWHIAVGILVAAVAVFEAYSAAIRGPFLFDDLYLVFMDPSARSNAFRFWLVAGRPLLNITYWVNYQISGDSPYLYHLVNIVFHLSGGILVFAILRRLLGRVGAEPWHRDLTAAFCAGIFLLHPIQTEAVAYVASRSENLSVMLAYAALAVFLTQGEEGISWLRSIAVVALFGMAVLTKEHTAVLPGLLVLTDYYFHPGFSLQGIRRNWRLYIPMVVAAAIGLRFIWRILRTARTAGFGIEGSPWYLYFFTQCKVIWIYVRMFLLPYGQNVDHAYPLVSSPTDPGAIAGMIGLIALAVAAFWFRKRYPLSSYGYFTFLILLAPTSSFVPIDDRLVERRIYLASIGLLLIVADWVRRIPLSRNALAGAMAAVVAVAGVATYQRSQVWSSSAALWEDSVAKNPENWRANFQLAYAYYQDQRCSESAAQYAKAAELSKPDYRLLVDWALAYDCAGQYPEALAKLRQAMTIEKREQAQAQIGMMLAKMGRYQEALQELDVAEKLNSRFAMTYFYRGNVYRALGQPAEAATAYQRALELSPTLDSARRGLDWAEQAMRQQGGTQ